MHIRITLKNCLLHLALSSLWALSVAFTIAGKVSAPGGAAIPGVVVSDGYTTTTTGPDGRYSMARNPLAKHVFISIPAEYAIPAEGNIPRFYQTIKGMPGSVEANFELTRQAKDKQFVLTVLADPQAQRRTDMDRFATETIPDLAHLKNAYPPQTSFVGLTVGDLLWDVPRMYPRYVKAFRDAPFPCFQTIGNHDHDEKTLGNDYEASHIYETYFGPTYYSFNRGDCHIVVLDNIIYHARKDYDETISEEQLKWLRSDLNHVNKNQLIIIAMHVPAYWPGGAAALKNLTQLTSILKGYNAIFLTGHTHRMNKTIISPTITDYTLSPVMGHSWAGNINVDGTPNGYGVFEIKGNKIINQYYKSTGHTPDYQMNLYPPGTLPKWPKSIVAHVWNYSQGWTVTAYENGRPKQTMRRTTGYDPTAYNFYHGKQKPARKPNLEPAKTPNLFRYTPQNPKAQIKVVVTDNFGNTYTTTLTKPATPNHTHRTENITHTEYQKPHTQATQNDDKNRKN